MKDAIEVARQVKSTDPEVVINEIFELIKTDKKWMGEIVMMYAESMLNDVIAIKEIVNEYNGTQVEDKKTVN